MMAKYIVIQPNVESTDIGNRNPGRDASLSYSYDYLMEHRYEIRYRRALYGMPSD